MTQNKNKTGPSKNQRLSYYTYFSSHNASNSLDLTPIQLQAMQEIPSLSQTTPESPRNSNIDGTAHSLTESVSPINSDRVDAEKIDSNFVTSTDQSQLPASITHSSSDLGHVVQTAPQHPADLPTLGSSSVLQSEGLMAKDQNNILSNSQQHLCNLLAQLSRSVSTAQQFQLTPSPEPCKLSTLRLLNKLLEEQINQAKAKLIQKLAFQGKSPQSLIQTLSNYQSSAQLPSTEPILPTTRTLQPHAQQLPTYPLHLFQQHARATKSASNSQSQNVAVAVIPAIVDPRKFTKTIIPQTENIIKPIPRRIGDQV